MPSTQVEIGQRQRRERTAGILLQAAVADFREAPQALDHGEDMFHPRADFRFVTVLPALHFVNLPVPAGTLIGEVFGVRRLRCDQLLLTGVRAVTVDTPLLPMQ